MGGEWRPKPAKGKTELQGVARWKPPLGSHEELWSWGVTLLSGSQLCWRGEPPDAGVDQPRAWAAPEAAMALGRAVSSALGRG